ncbi:hypothetical protein Tco_0904861, partial [Tanacetum coccineum]
ESLLEKPSESRVQSARTQVTSPLTHSRFPSSSLVPKKLDNGNRYSQKDKNKAKTGQNQAREWKEREKTKPKPKAYSS